MGESVKTIELTAAEKKAILEHAEFVILTQQTLKQLKQTRKSYISFVASDVEQIIAELIHHCRSVDDDATLMFFGELIEHLENYYP